MPPPPRDETDAPPVVQVKFLMAEADRHRLKTIALREDLSVQQIMHAAVNLWLEARGEAPLDWVPANNDLLKDRRKP